MATTYGDLRHLLPGNYKRLVSTWLEEDCPSLDYGGFVVGESEGEARLLGKSKVSELFICRERSATRVSDDSDMETDLSRALSPVSPSSTRYSHNLDART